METIIEKLISEFDKINKDKNRYYAFSFLTSKGKYVIQIVDKYSSAQYLSSASYHPELNCKCGAYNIVSFTNIIKRYKSNL